MSVNLIAKNRKVFSVAIMFLVVFLFQSAFLVTSEATFAPFPTAVDGRILTPNMTGDISNWVEIARNDGYSLIVRANYINIYPNGRCGEPAFQYCAYNGSNNDYTNYNKSKVRDHINAWFNGYAFGTADKLAFNARLRSFSVLSNATMVLGTSCNPFFSMFDGFSCPTIFQVGAGNDVAFALSYTESANFLSKFHFLRYAVPASFPSSFIAQANYCKINIPSYQSTKMTFAMWLRSPGDSSCGSWPMAGALGAAHDPRTFQINLTCVPASYIMGPSNCPFIVNTGAIDEHGLVYPALWVGSGIFETKGTINVIHRDAVDGTILRQDNYTVNPGNYGPYNAGSFTGYNYIGLAPGSDPISGTVQAGETKTITHLYNRVVTPIKVTYDPNGGTGTIIVDDVMPNTYYTIRQNPGYELQNHTFDGWNTKADGTGVSYSPGQVVYLTSPLTLFARWKQAPMTQVFYFPNGGIGEMKVVDVPMYSLYTISDQGYTWPPNYTQNGWNTQPNGTGTQYQSGQVVYISNVPLPLFAQWKNGNGTQYTITYYPNGGVGEVIEVKVNANTYYTIESQDYWRNDHRFNGWNTNPNGFGTDYSVGESILVTGNLSLYAKWMPNI
ncbi:MAG: InlB B-repeat-containing protein [Synergistaceae bacterium]|nr:InlB B-repeat-containing protein [Synergistaceae bacterium]